MKDFTAANLPSGNIEEFFAVSRCERRMTKSNKPYLHVVFADASGEVPGKAWDNADALEKILLPGSIIKVSAAVELYNGSHQLRVTDARSLRPDETVDPADFKPSSPFDTNHMYRQLLEYKNSINDLSIRTLLDSFFEQEQFAAKFKSHPAAKRMHHAYNGGLLEHTLSMLKSADLLARHYSYLNRDLLIAAVLLHDIGKLVEMDGELTTEYTTQGILVGHIPVGSEMVAKAADAIPGFSQDIKWQLQHCILSHHGRLEFGSPVLPCTLEAMVLHAIDYLDAQLFQARDAIEKDAASPSAFTEKVFGLDRSIYKSSFSSEPSSLSPAPVSPQEPMPDELNLKGSSPAQDTLL